MGGAESVVDVVVREAGELLGELGVVGFFFGVEAEVLQQQGLALFQLPGHLLGFGADAVGAESYVFSARQFLVQQHAQTLGCRLEAHRGIGFSLGPAEMGDQNQPCSVAESVFDGGEGFADAGVVDDAAIFERDVEVDAHEDAVIVEREVADGKL